MFYMTDKRQLARAYNVDVSQINLQINQQTHILLNNFNTLNILE